nr:hypothetical protein [Tanacetum cinerariifolium]
HVDHISEEVNSLHSKLVHQISFEINSSLPALVTNILKEQLPGLLSNALKDTIPQLIKDSIKSSVSESITEELSQVEAQAMKVFKKANAEGKKWEKNNPETPKDTDVQGEQSVAKDTTETTIVTYKSEEKKSEGPEEQQKSVQEFTDQLFATTFSKFSPTPPKEPKPHRDSVKRKEVAIVEEQVNELVSYQEEGGYIPKMPKIKSFITLEGTLSQEEYINQIKKIKRLSDLKAKKEKSEQELRKMFNQATLKARAEKLTEHEAKKAKMMEEYNHHISFIADPLPITKISYVVDSNKEATMKITRGDNPLNLIVHPNFRLRTLGFSEWLEFHALAFKKTGKSNDMILQSLRAKFQWFLKEAFVTENITADGMHKNLIPPLGVMPIQGLVINEPESGIFFMNGNTNIAFQRENEFYLFPTTELIQIHNQIKVGSKIASEMVTKMIYVIKSRSDCIEARKIVEKNLDNVG